MAMSKSQIANYFGMEIDGNNGMYRGHVYLELVSNGRGKKRTYILYREIEGSTDPCSNDSWNVVYTGNDLNEVCKHLFMYDEYETFYWDVAYNKNNSIWTSGVYNEYLELVA